MYLKPDALVEFKADDPACTGIVDGPGANGDAGARIRATNSATIRATVIGDITEMSASVSIHYDESLVGTTVQGP